MKPAPCTAIFNDSFFHFLITQSEEFAEKEKELESIFALKDNFERAAKFSLFLTNVIHCTIDSYNVQSFLDIFDYAKILYEEKKDCTIFAKLLKDGTIARYYSQFDKKNEDLMEFLTALKGFSGKNQELLSLFYNKTQEKTVFIFKNQKISGLQELFNFLGKHSNLRQVSAELLSSNEFRFWMEGNGYDIFDDM